MIRLLTLAAFALLLGPTSADAGIRDRLAARRTAAEPVAACGPAVAVVVQTPAPKVVVAPVAAPVGACAPAAVQAAPRRSIFRLRGRSGC